MTLAGRPPEDDDRDESAIEQTVARAIAALDELADRADRTDHCQARVDSTGRFWLVDPTASDDAYLWTRETIDLGDAR